MIEMETLSVEKLVLSRPATAEKISILLVDDEQRNLDVLESVLTSPELHLVRAKTPQEALIALVHNEFACIIMDIQMPEMSGLELSRLIKTRKRNQHVPIIFLTAFFLEEKDILQGYGAGAVEYLMKPFNPQILRSKVGVFVDLFRTTQALAVTNNALEQEVLQRKKVEEALRVANRELEVRVEARTADLSLTEQRYRRLVQSLPAAVYTTDADGRVILYNEAAAILWGRKPEIGKDLWCGSHKIFKADGSALALDQCPMAITLKTGNAVRGEEIIIERPDGSRRNVLPYPEPLFDAAGKIAGAINMLVDVTERKLWEKELRRFAAIVESSDDAIISKDLNGIITSWNDGAMRIFGYTAEEVIGKSITMLIPKERQDEEPGILQRIRKGDRVDHYETIRQRKDGALIGIELTISPIKNAEGKIIGASKIARDITKRKLVEKELSKAHEDIMAASRAKDDFLATLSHELRTPLNPVLLIASDAVNNHELSPGVRMDFNTILKNIELEARLIDDLLDLTRITSGKVILDKRIIDVHSVCREAVATVHEEIIRKQIVLKLNLAAAQSEVFADMVRLQQVFWNLLKNAVKFTPEHGLITVESEVSERDHIAIRFVDTGIGIEAGEMNRLFKTFSQGEQARQLGGLGLGLAISKRLVDVHEAKIHAFSNGRDQGATFTVELPLAKVVGKSATLSDGSAAASEASLPVNTLKNIRILLVEDHEPTRKTLALLLMRRRYEVVAAASIAEALAQRRNFHVLISDIGLPDGNGCDLMIEMRKRASIQGIALTGFGMEEDIARSQEAGFLMHLTKPVKIQALEKALNAAVKLCT